ncbi:MAG: helix-turn-helix transcriptional regulator, partial [Eubacteriales bacterium]|nr:helix-turn-helix transcriptional regulator [Eubacteriales bacterium]
MTEKEIYFRPKQAGRKLKTALELGNAAYLYGVTGIGKTALARSLLAGKPYEYYTAEEAQPEEIPEKKEGKERMIVIDDLHCVTLQEYQESYALLIKRLLEQESVKLILISRAPVPGWLLSVHVEYRFIEIGERDFYFSREEQDKYLRQSGLNLDSGFLQKAWELGKGHPVSLKILAMENGDLDRAVKSMWLWLENHVFDQWEKELGEFLMETSIVENERSRKLLKPEFPPFFSSF